MIDHLFGLVAVILFLWSAALVGASWQLGHALRLLAEERRELRRWKRLHALYERQRQPWN